MRRRISILGSSLIVSILAMLLVVGLAVPASAVAAKHRPHAILQVELNGTPVRAYSLAALKALTPFAGYAGFRKSSGTIVGPDTVTGVRVTDILAAALHRPLTADESVEVASVPPFSPNSRTFSYDRLVNFTDFTMYDATTKNPVSISDLTGPLAAVLIYSDPEQKVMPPANGPLRFIVADATSENVVMYPAGDSVYQVNHLNVIDADFAGRIALKAGDDQSATAGTAVSTPPSVIVEDAHGNPAPGVSVTFAVALGGGSVTGSSATTDSAGIATVGSWTLGATAGTNTLTATSSGLSGSPVTFTATGTAGPAAQMALNAGDGQSATSGTVVSTPPSVTVEDVNSNPVSGVTVTFAVTSGGGSVSDSWATTDAAGIAAVGSWTLGTTAGTNTLAATSDGLAGSPVTFTATGTAGPAAQIAVNAGDGQSASAGTALSTPPSVIVEDVNSNPVSGIGVSFAVASGSGSASGLSTTTNAAGIAAVGSWTLGATAGANTLTATSGSLSGSPLTFSATGTAGVLQVQYNGQPVRAYSLSELEALTPFAGNAGFRKSTGTIVGPDAITGAKVTDVVADALGTPLTATESVNVAAVPPNSAYNKTFSYDRLINFTDFTMYDATTRNPVAISSLTGPLAAVLIYSDPAQRVMPTSSGPLRFVIADATSENVVMSPSGDSVSSANQLNVIQPGPATQIALNAGNNQTATAGATVGTPPSVIVKDANGYPVPGVSVTFAVASGGGSVTGSPATTNAAGIATVGSWTLGATAGANTLTASSDGLAGSPVTFSATGTAGPAAQIAVNVGDGQSASAGTALSTPPSVIVEDVNSNPVSGVTVTFAVASGGGSATGLSATTNAAGIAAVGSWTLGATAGANTLTATSGSLSSSPLTFTATGTAGVLQVQYNGRPVRAYSMTQLQALTPFAGNAGFRKSTGTIVGPDTITGAKVTDIVADALGTPLTTGESVDVAQASPYYGRTFSYDRLINFTDFTMYDATTRNPVAISSLTGPLAAVLIYSDPAQRVMPTSSGPLRFVIADATSENVVMSPSGDSVSNANQLNVIDPSVATQMALNAGDGQSATVGSAVSTPQSVIVKDAHGYPVPGVSVTFAVASGGGSATGLSATTNAAGIAAVGSWTLGATAGTNTLTATSGTLSGSPVTFSATGTAGPAAQIAVNAGNGQSASAGTAVSMPPSVIVEDVNSNPVSGIAVTFAVASGGGSVTGSPAATNAAGIAAVGSWTLGATAGTNTLTATSGTLSGSPLTFTATGTAGVLQVQYNGTPVRAYSLSELEALTPFAGNAGFYKSGAVTGPDAITGAKVTDIVADALGTPLTTGESVNVASVPPNSPYNRTFSYGRLIDFTDFTMYDATTKNPVAISGLTGPLAAVLIYSDPAGLVMPVAKGPLRFVIADATSENVVMYPSSDSVSSVNQLNVTGP